MNYEKGRSAFTIHHSPFTIHHSLNYFSCGSPERRQPAMWPARSATLR
jgi:hypothetical protein